MEKANRQTPQARYDATHIKPLYMKLNINHDADIIAKLETVPSKQGYIKRLIREDIQRNGKAEG